MKKNLLAIKSSLVVVSLGVLAPAAVLAATPTPEDNCQNFLKQFGDAFSWADGRKEFCTIQQFLLWILQNALAFAGTVAVVFIVIGGYRYLTSAGNEEAAESGRKTLLNSVIGLAVIIMSFVIVRVVTNFLTSGT